MKKRKIKNLDLNKKRVSNLQTHTTIGGAEIADSISTLRFICTNHPKQDTDFCGPTASVGCFVTQNGEHSCNCTIA